jgi:hypothetical protein
MPRPPRRTPKHPVVISPLAPGPGLPFVFRGRGFCLPRTTLTAVGPSAHPIPPGRHTSFTQLKTAPYQHGGA